MKNNKTPNIQRRNGRKKKNSQAEKSESECGRCERDGILSLQWNLYRKSRDNEEAVAEAEALAVATPTTMIGDTYIKVRMEHATTAAIKVFSVFGTKSYAMHAYHSFILLAIPCSFSLRSIWRRRRRHIQPTPFRTNEQPSVWCRRKT